MRRLLTLAVLLCCSIPFGVSVSGCSKAASVVYCNGQSGVAVGQLTTITFTGASRFSGVSLNAGQIGQVPQPSGADCKGSNVALGSTVYGSMDVTLVDVVPATGALCAGTWNRNTGGGIPDYTVCRPNNRTGLVFVTAASQGVTSDPFPVYIHPVVSSIVLGPASTDCTNDPASNCYNNQVSFSCATGAPAATTAPPYTSNACVSQGLSTQLAARTYTGTGAGQTNISCLVGPPTFSAQNANIVSIDAVGVAKAAQPGSTIITAGSSLSSSSAGIFSTCPPKSIVLSTAASPLTPPTTPIAVNQNIAQTLTATVTDTNNNPITNITLEYLSTSPTTIPTALNVITPTFPGAAAIFAVCQPPLCNPSPLNQIGLFPGTANGVPVISNPVQITATGTNNSTVLYAASTNSQYLQPYDFTVATQSAPVRLPFVPNSMVLSEDLTTIYMGTSTEIMVYATGSNSLIREDPNLSGNVLAVSPDNATVVITDPVRKLIYLYNSAGSIVSEYGGVATRAVWSPDSQYVYITTTDGNLLVYSPFLGWRPAPLSTFASDVTVTVPNAGVYLAGTPVTARTNCPQTTVTGPTGNQQTTNVFFPLADTTSANGLRLAATNDGTHILTASTTALTDITTNRKSGACPVAFTSSTGAPMPFAGVTITTPGAATPNNTGPGVHDVLPTSDALYAFVTFDGTGGVLPQYAQGANGAAGVLTELPLQTTTAGKPVAPEAAVISSDNNTVYVGTSGDNTVHRLTRGATGYTDSLAPLMPNLPVFNGTGFATPNLLVQRPRKSTS